MLYSHLEDVPPFYLDIVFIVLALMWLPSHLKQERAYADWSRMQGRLERCVGGGKSYRWQYTYTVAGQEYTGYDHLPFVRLFLRNALPKAGDEVMIVVDPSNSENSYLYTPTSIPDRRWIMLGIAALLVADTLYWWLYVGRIR